MMIGKQMKKLIIVCDESTIKYGNLLRQLISTNDDGEETVGVEDGTVDAVVWDIKQYADNAPTISTSSYLLFIGENKASKPEIRTMPIKFNRFGMKYGWRGKRGVVIVDKVLKDPDLINEFELYNTQFEEKGFEKEPNTIGEERTTKLKKIAVIGSHVLLPGSGFLVDKKFKHDDMKESQYYSLTVSFYLNGINEFMQE